jgi:hypothetical protein
MTGLTFRERFAFRFIFRSVSAIIDYLDEVCPYIVDWLRRHLAGAEAGG